MNKVREGYKTTGLGIIPEAWSIKKLNNVFERITDKNKDNYSDNVLTISAQMGLVNQEEFFNKNIASKNTSNYYLLNRGDFAYNKSYSAGYPMGAIKRLNKYDKGIVSPLYICFRKKSELISGKFYEHFFEYTIFDNAIASIAQEGARNHGLLNVNIGDFFELPIIVPPIEEQEKIASILSTVDEQIDNVNALIEKNKELKKGLMQTLLTKGIGHTKFKKTEIGEVPSEWYIKSIDEITKEVYRYPTYYGIEYVEEGIAEIRGELLNDDASIKKESFRYISEKTAKKFPRTKLEGGDIVISVRGTIGKVGYITEELAGSNITANLLRVSMNRNIMNEHFVKQLFLSDIMKRKFDEITTATTIKTFKVPEFKQIILAIPTKDEQDKIASILLEVDKKIEEHENKKQKLEELKKGLMQQLLTGMIRVTV